MTASRQDHRIYRDSADLAAHIREQAATVVRNVNPGRAHSGPAFDAKTAEVAAAMAAKLIRDNASRPHVAAAIRAAWDASR